MSIHGLLYGSLLSLLWIGLCGLCGSIVSACQEASSDVHDKVQWSTTTTHQQQHRSNQQQMNANWNVSLCGTRDWIPTESEEMMLQNKIATFQNTFAKNNKAFDPVTIDVSFQVIADGFVGNIPQESIVNQMNILNEAFADYGFQFKLRETKRTNSATLHSRCAASGNNAVGDGYGDDSFKKQLRKSNDGPDVLYIYTCVLEGPLGYGTFPNEAAAYPLFDGIVCHSETLPGGSFVWYNLGKNAIHHVGHWLGLFHTFQGGCTGDGDYVNDTPAVAYPNRDCAYTIDSCPSDPGNDLTNNYMDFTYHSCKTDFTNGQALRMQASWNVYRSVGTASNCNIFLSILAFILKLLTFGLVKLCE